MDCIDMTQWPPVSHSVISWNLYLLALNSLFRVIFRKPAWVMLWNPIKALTLWSLALFLPVLLPTSWLSMHVPDNSSFPTDPVRHNGLSSLGSKGIKIAYVVSSHSFIFCSAASAMSHLINTCEPNSLPGPGTPREWVSWIKATIKRKTSRPHWRKI